jgi:hypothetical protein
MDSIIRACDPSGVVIEVGGAGDRCSTRLARRVDGVIELGPRRSSRRGLRSRALGRVVLQQGPLGVGLPDLDHVELNRVRLLIIDLHPAPELVLQGAVQLLHEWAPVVLLKRGFEQDEVPKLLEGLGYLARGWEDGRWHRLQARSCTQPVVFAHGRSTWVPW